MRMFWHRLALSLGMSVARAQQEISPAEFLSWVAFSRIEPIGPARGDVQAGIVSSVIANCNRTGGKVFTPNDFVPRWGERAAAKTVDVAAMARKFEVFANIHNSRQRKV